MAKDPFGFDLSVSTDKKKRSRTRRGMSGAFETSTRQCQHAGCTNTGQYRAPKSPDDLDEFYWFCKEHVREYNLKWNFFHGHTEEEMAKQIDRDRVWERETKPFGKDGEEARAWSRLGVDDPHQILGENATQNPGKSITGSRRLLPTERRALDILEAKRAQQARLRLADEKLQPVRVLLQHPAPDPGIASPRGLFIGRGR